MDILQEIKQELKKQKDINPNITIGEFLQKKLHFSSIQRDNFLNEIKVGIYVNDTKSEDKTHKIMSLLGSIYQLVEEKELILTITDPDFGKLPDVDLMQLKENGIEVISLDEKEMVKDLCQ